MGKTRGSFTKSELKKLRESLPPLWKNQLASEFDLETGTIANILYGSQTNNAVVLAAIELAKKHRAFIDSQRQAIKTL